MSKEREARLTDLAHAPEIATRKAGEAFLNVIASGLPELITSSADLTPSNNTKVAATRDLTPDDMSGRYMHWGIREHGMAAVVLARRGALDEARFQLFHPIQFMLATPRETAAAVLWSKA